MMGLNLSQGLFPRKDSNNQEYQTQRDHSANNQQANVSLQSTATPSACSSSWTLSSIAFPPSTILIQNAIHQLLDTTCFPNNFTAFGRVKLGPIYDPGSCPDGYFEVDPPINVDDGTTTARCCQNGFHYTSFIRGLLTFEGCTSTISGPTSVAAVISIGQTTTTSANAIGLLTMWGKPLTIVSSRASAPPSPQISASATPPAVTMPSLPNTLPTIAFSSATDSLTLTSGSSTSANTSESGQPASVPSGSNNTAVTLATTTITSSTPALSSAQTITSTPSAFSSTSHQETHSNHLSSGAKAGISIGVLLGLALLALLALLLLRRRRKHSRENFIMQYPSPSQNPLTDLSERVTSIPSLMVPNTEQLQPRKSWRLPARLPSWGSRRANQTAAVRGSEGEMQEAPVSPVSSMSRSSSRGSRVSRGMSISDGRHLEPKGDMDTPVSPISPVR